MKTNAGAARMLALAALAGLLGDARAGAGQRARGKCDAHTTPKITVNAREKLFGWYIKSYGEDIDVNCSANDTAKLGLKENSIYIQSNQTNTTSIQFRVTTPNIGTYTFSCADSGTGCGAFLRVLVRPATSVKSSIIQEREVAYTTYYVPFGDNYEVYCSGNDGASLFFETFGKRLQTDDIIVNGTTIKQGTHFIKSSYYSCTANVIGVTGKQQTVTSERILVLHFPTGYHFRCILKHSLTIECTWTYLYAWETVTYTLFYLNHDLDGQEVQRPCVKGGEQNNTCKWSIRLKKEFYYNNHNFSFILMTCRDVLCYNQTFLMNVYSITRLDSDGSAEVSNTGSQDVVLMWCPPYSFISTLPGTLYEFICTFRSYEYKVEYRLTAFGDRWHATIVSSVHCDDEQIRCKYRLALPYPDAGYEVRVSTRFKQATDDRLWSDPVSTFVHTKPRAECACERSAEPTTKYSFDSVSCDTCTFTRDTTINNNLALKRKVQDVKQKLAKINYIKMGKELHYSD